MCFLACGGQGSGDGCGLASVCSVGSVAEASAKEMSHPGCGHPTRLL